MAVAFKIITDVAKMMDDHAKKTRKAMQTALKREGFLLTGELKKFMRKGEGQEKLSVVSRYKRGKITRRKVLNRTDEKVPIQYNADSKNLSVSIGMVDTRYNKVSKSWKMIFRKQQEGFTTIISDGTRRYWKLLGVGLPKKSKNRKYFFLKKATKVSRTPARPIIEPFKTKTYHRSLQRLSDNFHKKMRGERI